MQRTRVEYPRSTTMTPDRKRAPQLPQILRSCESAGNLLPLVRSQRLIVTSNAVPNYIGTQNIARHPASRENSLSDFKVTHYRFCGQHAGPGHSDRPVSGTAVCDVGWKAILVSRPGGGAAPDPPGLRCGSFVRRDAAMIRRPHPLAVVAVLPGPASSQSTTWRPV